MPDNLNLNQKLENNIMRELFEKRKNVDTNDKDAVNAVMGEIADELVMRSRFLSVVSLSKPPIEDEKGNAALDKGTNINFALLDNGSGARFFPIFTDSEELAKWDSPPSQTTIQLGFDNYASMVEGNGSCEGIVVNPFSDNLLLNKSIVIKWYEKKQVMTKGHAQHVITDDSQYELYAPNPYPMLLSNTVCAAAKAFSAVNAMWLRGIRLNNEDGYLLVVDFNGDRQKIFAALGESAKPFLADRSLHIVALDEGFGRKASENVVPIYTKE